MSSYRLSFGQKLRLLWQAFFDPRTPLVAKLLVVLGLFYGISPFDLIPDVIPLLGQLDDAAVLIAVLLLFLRMTSSVRKDLGRKNVIDTTGSSHPH